MEVQSTLLLANVSRSFLPDTSNCEYEPTSFSCYWYQYTFHVQSQHPLPSTSRYPAKSLPSDHKPGWPLHHVSDWQSAVCADNLFIIEIRNQERSAMSLHDTSEIFQGNTDISTLAVGMEIQHFPNDIKNMFSSLLRRNILFNSVREKITPILSLF